MSNYTPIAIIIFNRPDHARKLRDCLEKQQERDLYVIVDGARENKLGEKKLVDECISIFKNWKGDVKFNISDINLGCKARISSGLNWVFEHTERAIILEDDLSPSHQFFRFCDEMLESYENNEDVMSVCGTKTFPGHVRTNQYFFSMYNNCWGWATWRKSWIKYQDDFSQLSPIEFISKLRKVLGSYRAALYWYSLYRMVLLGKRSSWAYCWMLTCFFNNALHIYPASNLVVNSGFGDDSTHTTSVQTYMPQRYGEELKFPLYDNELKIKSFSVADSWIEDNIYSKSLRIRLTWFKQRFLT